MAHALRIVLAPFIMVLVSVSAGCSTGKTNDKQLRYVGPADAEALVSGGKKVLGLGGSSRGVFVDARSEEAFKAGHIPGAISLPYERVTRDHKSLNGYDALVIYGDDYNDPRAKGMSKRLIELKHDNVHTLTGGVNQWKDEGFELVTEP